MHRTTLVIAFIVCIATGLVTAKAAAQPFTLNWYTIDGGGGTSTGGTFELSGTIGQPDASGALTAGSFELTGGFWADLGTGGPCSDADFVEPFGVLDFFDVLEFLGAFAAMESSADMNNDTVHDFFDVQLFLQAFSMGCP